MSCLPSLLPNKQLFSYKQAAEMLGYHPASLRRLVHLGRLPHIKIGPVKVMFTLDQLRSLVHVHGPAVVAPAHGRRAKRARGKQ